MAVNWDLYEKYIKDADSGEIVSIVADTVADMISALKETASYQPTATHNGTNRPLCMTIKNGRIGDVTMVDGAAIYAGDYIHCYGKDWLVVEVKVDELGMVYATCWLCNYTLKFQNGTPTIYTRLVVVDDGSYSSLDKKQIATTVGKRSIYLPRDNQTKYIYPGKRLAVGTIFDSAGVEICDAYCVRYEDHLGINLRIGDHLERLDLENTDFSMERDSVADCICDYIAGAVAAEEVAPTPEAQVEDPDDTEDSEPDETEAPAEPVVTYHIVGNQRVRLGTSRKYVLQDDNNEAQLCTWTVSGTNSGISYTVDNNGVLTLITGSSPLLIGTTLVLTALVNTVAVATFNVEVISIA